MLCGTIVPLVYRVLEKYLGLDQLVLDASFKHQLNFNREESFIVQNAHGVRVGGDKSRVSDKIPCIAITVREL